jgi:ketosteroid isomerase-like protein
MLHRSTWSSGFGLPDLLRPDQEPLLARMVSPGMSKSSPLPSDPSFGAFLKRRSVASQAYVRGEFEPLGALTPRTGKASFFGPTGGTVNTARRVFARYKQDAAAFLPVGKTRLQTLHSEVAGKLAFWVGIQHATAQMKGMKKPVPMSLRLTEIYRREKDGWKLIHRHADPLVEAKQ